MATAEPSKEPTDSRLMRQLGTLRRSLIYAHGRARAFDLRPEEANEALAGGDYAVLGAAAGALGNRREGGKITVTWFHPGTDA